jgi:hypothetical protein
MMDRIAPDIPLAIVLFRSGGRGCAPGCGQATGATAGARHRTRTGHRDGR